MGTAEAYRRANDRVAVAMITRFQNLFLKNLRALRDLRRYSVVINNPKNVNFGDKQVIVGGDAG